MGLTNSHEIFSLWDSPAPAGLKPIDVSSEVKSGLVGSICNWIYPVQGNAQC